MSEFGEYIKKIRERKGYSQRQLALYSTVSNTEISKIESGERKNPAPDTLKKLAPHLGVTYEELMEAAGYLDEVATEKSTKQIKDAIGDDPELLEFWNDLTTRDDLLIMFKQARKLPPDEVKKIIRIIKAIEDEEAQEDF